MPASRTAEARHQAHQALSFGVVMLAVGNVLGDEPSFGALTITAMRPVPEPRGQ